MIRPGPFMPLPLLLLALAACSDRPGTDGSESDFASRVGAGQGGSASAAATVTASPGAVTAVRAGPPAGADVFAMEKLGDISAVDLGPRAGGCTFSASGTEMLVAAGPADRALPGKAAVRVGGQLLQLDAAPGGVAAIKAGTSFSGEGFSIRVQPTAPGKAIIATTNGEGETRQVSGDWVCA